MEGSIIDIHTHAFPDALARRAMRKLLDETPDVRAYLDGTLAALLRSMDACGIQKSVVSCIATHPGQFESILHWCEESQSERLLFLPSVHPQDPRLIEQVDRIKAAGFKGIKLHPFYQDFYADQESMQVLYEKLQRECLLLLMHTGYDVAFERIRRADPQMLVRISERYPELRLITSHFGAWEQWDEVEQYMIGRPIYMDISFAMEYMEPGQARRMILNHPEGYVLFGSDSPWTDQGETLSQIRKLDLPRARLDQILAENAEKLLH